MNSKIKKDVLFERQTGTEEAIHENPEVDQHEHPGLISFSILEFNFFFFFINELYLEQGFKYISPSQLNALATQLYGKFTPGVFWVCLSLTCCRAQGWACCPQHGKGSVSRHCSEMQPPKVAFSCGLVLFSSPVSQLIYPDCVSGEKY